MRRVLIVSAWLVASLFARPVRAQLAICYAIKRIRPGTTIERQLNLGRVPTRFCMSHMHGGPTGRSVAVLLFQGSKRLAVLLRENFHGDSDGDGYLLLKGVARQVRYHEVDARWLFPPVSITIYFTDAPDAVERSVLKIGDDVFEIRDDDGGGDEPVAPDPGGCELLLT